MKITDVKIEVVRRALPDTGLDSDLGRFFGDVEQGVLRILTHPRVFNPPTPGEAAIDFIDALLAQPAVTPLRPGSGHWRIFRGIAAGLRLTGNRIPDAYHAALAIEHGCEWVTLDHGFSAYPGLRWRNLLRD